MSAEDISLARQAIEPGIYFSLSDTEYHADGALGSTNMKQLLQSAPDFWWQSPMNPAREPEKETPAKVFGRAVHKAVLEGADAFRAIYAPTDHPGNVKAGKDEVAAIREAGMIPLKRDDFNRILAASAFIGANRHLSNAFKNGMPEVSVFWDCNGVMMKARFDYLKLNAISDLKSIRNRMGKEFTRACRDAIASYEYILSAEHYMEGRRQMAKLIADGAVYGDHDAERLARVAANEVFAFVLVFWQAEQSPIAHGFKLSPGNPMLGYGRHWIEKAVDTYRRFMAEFGPDTAWVLQEPLEELDESEMAGWWQHKQTTGA
jgi:hypothetical protein